MSPLFVRISLSTLGLAFGILVLAFSLAVTNNVPSEMVRVSKRQMYFGSEILPDHVLYPFVMAADRLYFIQADESQKMNIQISYSFRRMEYAHTMMRKGKVDLAETTITKAQKYINLAAYQARDESVDMETKRYVYQAFLEHTAQLRAIGLESTVVNNLHLEGVAMAEQLKKQLEEQK